MDNSDTDVKARWNLAGAGWCEPANRKGGPVPVGQFDDNFDPKISFYLQCGSPYLAYWNWPFPAGWMPRFP